MRSILTKKLMAVLLAVCMIAALMPVGVFAADSATQTADFTTGECENAITLLNQYKTGTEAEDSLWDSGTKTLTLKGIDFTTTAATAVKLPAGSTIVLQDGTSNTIQSGDVTLSISDDHKKQAFVNALEAEGNLTIQGGTTGSGTLSVFAGKLKNSVDGWVYSSGISVDGDFTVKGGRVTARGGSVKSNGSCFSYGVKIDSNTKNKALMVTGGTLTAIADKAYELEEGGNKRAVFSRGVEMYRGNVIVSGDGKLCAESVKEMAEATVMSNGLYISAGNLTVADSAEVAVAGGYGAYISGGSLQLDGGSITAVSTQTPDDNGNLGYALSVELNKQVADSGNITVSGGTLETVNGQIYVSAIDATESQGMFTVTGGTIVNRGQLYGPKKVEISGGTVQTRRIDANALTLFDGTLTIREPVRKQRLYNGELYALPALDVSNLTVSGGTLDAAWDWGEFTPIVLPKYEEYNDVGILVRMPSDSNTAAFNGGTTILNTGYAGNTALLIKGQMTIGDGMAETGADANHCQLKSDIPVKIAAAAASTTIATVDVENVKLDYQPGSVPQASAKRAGADQDKYDILFECWEKREKDANDAMSTVGYWYSDESGYSDGDSRFDTFDRGGRYRYSVKLKAKDDYTFDSNLSNKNVTLNGASLLFDSWINVLDDGRTCLIQYGTEMRPGQTVEEIRLDGAVINFTAGDKPRFSGAVDSYIDIDHQRWDANDGSGYGITSSDFWNIRYDGKLITEFEAGKSYTYGVYFKISDLGMEKGYSFDKNTKLYINGKEITLTPDQISVDDNGETIWFSNVMTITPKAFSGGGYYVPVQKPEIIIGEGGKATLENNGTTLVIAPDDGMQISKVTVNGNEVTVTDNKITGLKTGDKVEVTFDKIPPAKEEIDKAFKEKLLNLGLTVRTSKTTKKNVKAVVKETSELKDLIKEIKDAGYTVKYKFYRSTKKSSKYIATVTKTENTYTNTTGKKGTKYYYKARLAVYDTDGNLVAQTELKQCKYGLRTWSK